MNQIKRMREALKLTQDSLAKMLNVERSTVSKWENGEAMPRADRLLELAKLLNCTVNELLDKTTA